MTSPSLPAKNENSNWQWLQQRVEAKATDRFTDWLSAELDSLEHRFAHLVTRKSLSRQLRSQRSPADAR